jgi:hypothetical protein
MQNLFVKPEDELKIRLSVLVDQNGAIYCDINQDFLKKSLEGVVAFENCTVSDYEVVFRKPSFGDTVKLYDEIFSVDNSASLRFNPLLALYKKISLLIKSWTITEDGSSKKPTDAEIAALHPIVANSIGVSLNAETGGILNLS